MVMNFLFVLVLVCIFIIQIQAFPISESKEHPPIFGVPGVSFPLTILDSNNHQDNSVTGHQVSHLVKRMADDASTSKPTTSQSLSKKPAVKPVPFNGKQQKVPKHLKPLISTDTWQKWGNVPEKHKTTQNKNQKQLQ